MVQKVLFFLGVMMYAMTVVLVSGYLGFVIIPQVFLGFGLDGSTAEQQMAMLDIAFMVYWVSIIPHVWGLYSKSTNKSSFIWKTLALIVALLVIWRMAWNTPAQFVFIVLVAICATLVYASAEDAEEKKNIEGPA